MGSIFRFKQFEVDQGNCAMKINTDGVILGAAAHHEGARRILDVGTGTGVIALMLAQRYPQAFLDAIDIDQGASQQAAYNFDQSVFSNRLRSINSNFQDYHPPECYELIVSNPPFYTNSLHNPDPRKKLAKHADEMFFANLLDFVGQYLSVDGKFQCILPVALADEIVREMLPSRGLYLHHQMSVASYADEDPIRTLLTIGKIDRETEHDSLLIYERRGEHSTAYKTLLKPYFLAF